MKNVNNLNLVFVFLLFFGCKKEDFSNSQLDSQNFFNETFILKKSRISNEMLTFESYKEFIDSLNLLKKEDINSILKKSKENKFITLFEYYQSQDEKFLEEQVKKFIKNEKIDESLIMLRFGNDNHLEEKITNRELTFLLNQNREILIGKKIFRYDYDFYETTDLITTKKEKNSFNRAISRNNKGAKISAYQYQEAYYNYSGNSYKIYVLNDYFTFCGYTNTNGDDTNGCFRSRHLKRFLGQYIKNSTNFVSKNGNLNRGLATGYLTNDCYTCGTDYYYINGNYSCTSCSTAELDWGNACYNGYNGVWGAFNCDDGVARQLYL